MRLSIFLSAWLLCSPGLVQAQPTEIDVSKCAPGIDRETISVLAQELSGGEMFALTPFGGEALPYANRMDATAVLQNTANQPEQGWLVGVMQVHTKTIEKEGLKPEEALDPCTNLRLAAKELKACFKTKTVNQADEKLKPLLRCFFSSRMPKDAIPERIQAVMDRVKPTVPALSSLMKAAPEVPLVFSVQNHEQPLIF